MPEHNQRRRGRRPTESRGGKLAPQLVWYRAGEPIIRPGQRALRIDHAWWEWLPRLGALRWVLVTALRQMCAAQQESGRERVQLVVNARELAPRLGLSEKELYRLLQSEPIPGQERWRQLALPPANRRYRIQEANRVRAMRRFIPRLRYHSQRVDGVTRRVGFVLELAMELFSYQRGIAETPDVNGNEEITASISPGESGNAKIGLDTTIVNERMGVDTLLEGGVSGQITAEIPGVNPELATNAPDNACEVRNWDATTTLTTRKESQGEIGRVVITATELQAVIASFEQANQWNERWRQQGRDCASDAERRRLRKLCEEFTADQVLAAIDEAVETGVDYLAIKYLRSILERWASEGEQATPQPTDTLPERRPSRQTMPPDFPIPGSEWTAHRGIGRP